MKFEFKKATKTQSRARIALIGPSGSGKTMTALRLATGLGDKIALIDTERGSASKYAHRFDFCALDLETFHPQNYIDAIHAAAEAGFEVLVIDSLSHAWAGPGGALELVDKAAKKSQSGNSYTAWRDVTPLHNALLDAILRAPLHIIATLRAKTEYAMEKDDRGKTVPRKIGLAPIFRDNSEYEFDIVADIDADHNMIISKSRCEALDGGMFNKAGEEVAEQIKAWLTDGAPAHIIDRAELSTQILNIYTDLGYTDAQITKMSGKLRSMSDKEIESAAADARAKAEEAAGASSEEAA